jgi:hypothetical protein
MVVAEVVLSSQYGHIHQFPGSHEQIYPCSARALHFTSALQKNKLWLLDVLCCVAG